MSTIYQLRFRHAGGGISYEYALVLASQDKALICAVKANEWAGRFRERHNGLFKPPRVVTATEYDHERKCVKRNGDKFKLRLRFIEALYRNGRKVREEWYEAME